MKLLEKIKPKKTVKKSVIQETDRDWQYSLEKRKQLFSSIVSHFFGNTDELYSQFESSELNLFEFLHGKGIPYRDIAQVIAREYGKGYKERIDEDVIIQDEKLIGTKSRISYHFLPSADVVIPYDEYLNYHRERKASEERGEIQEYIYSLVERCLNIQMTDLFIEPERDFYTVSYKELGGGRIYIEVLSREKGKMVINALKMMASRTKDSNIKVNVDNEAQSGKISIPEYGIEIRVEFIPTVLGEGVAMRFFKIGGYFNIHLEDLGYTQEVIEVADKISKLQKGMVLVSGATGHGKSTLIRSIILRADPTKKVVRAVEDPVENVLRGVSHIQVKEGIISFSQAIRSFMRANPDIIFVGEVRDPETAIALIEASITGHLTFSTTHANTSITAIARLLAKAQETNLFSREELLTNIATSLVASFSQRLVKLTEKGQQETGRKVLPVVEMFVPEKEDRELIEQGKLLELEEKMKDEKRDMRTKLNELYEKGWIDRELLESLLEE